MGVWSPKIDFKKLEDYCIICETMVYKRKSIEDVWGMFKSKNLSRISAEKYKKFIDMRKEFVKNGKQHTEWDGTRAGNLPVVITFINESELEKKKYRFLITKNEKEARELYGWNF